MSYSQREDELIRENERLKNKLRHFAQALLDADHIAQNRGKKFGLCDCIDNAGDPYASQWKADLLAFARDELKAQPSSRLTEKSIHAKWSTAKQWD